MSKTQPVAIPRRTPATWTADERVNQCFTCRREFGMFVRKHHCRVCGRIFCSECSSFKIKVPSFIRHFIASSYDGKPLVDEEKRVCSVCYGTTKTANATRREIYIIANLPLDIKSIHRLMFVSKSYCGAVTTLLSLWNSIQYKLPHTKFTKLEKSLIINRLPELKGHSAWAIQVIKALDVVPPGGEKTTPCKGLMCGDSCKPRLTVYDLLELYTHNHQMNVGVDRWSAQAWEKVDCQDHVRLMPWWVHIFRQRPHIATGKFIHHIAHEVDVVYAFLFELKLQSQDVGYQTILLKVLNECLRHVSKDIRKDWEKSEEFLRFLERVASTDMTSRRERFICDFIIQQGEKMEIRAPWDPDIWIHRVGMDIKTIQSASKPIQIPLYTNKGTIDILFKKEDVRKDKMTMDMTYWLEKITEGAVAFTRYDVFPVTASSGIIVMLNNVTTLYDIKHKHRTTLQNFILDRNSDLTVEKLRTRFVKSVAAACVLSYVIGVGDRHLENMLVTDDGKLIHVDFSYLLGDDPKHVKNEMRITPDMLDALGGTGSSTFTQFQELCSDVYKKIREKSSFWYCLLVYLSDATPRVGNFWGKRIRIQRHVLERLCPGEMDEHACMQIVEIVKRSSKDGWSNSWSDTAHSLAKNMSGMFNLEL